ncbi:MAG TPA: MFS transporter, partial [Chloroflexota bacterium]|nr:MFS transporter [Chloroflexota bacterium]
ELGVPLDDVPRWTGLLASASLAIALPLSPFWGVLADRYSRKAVMLRSQLVEAAVFGLAAFTGDVGQLLLVRLLLGLSYGNMAVVMATQSMVTPDRRVGISLGVIQMSSTLAISVGPLMGSLLINAFGIRTMFAVDALLTLSAALLLFVGFREPDVHDRTTPVLDKLKLVLEQITNVPAVRWNFIAWFLIFGGTAVLDPLLPALIDRLAVSGDSATATGALLAFYGLLTALATPVAGRLADRVGAERMFLVAAPLLALVAGGFAMAASLPILAVLVILRALPQSSTAVVLYSHLAAHVPVQHRAAVMSLTPMPRNAAWFIMPGAAAAASGLGIQAVFWLAAALFAGAAVVAVLMLRSSRAGSGQDVD